jgi:hypothetical protein
MWQKTCPNPMPPTDKHPRSFAMIGVSQSLHSIIQTSQFCFGEIVDESLLKTPLQHAYNKF